jgi:hypothetical protein
MKKKITIVTVLTVLILFSNSISNAQTFQWVKNQTHNISFNPDFASSPSASDNNGNSYLASIYNYKLSYTLDFLGDFSLKKFDPSGNQLFNKIFYGKLLINGLQTDGGRNVYLSGLFMDTLKIDSVNYLFNTGSGFNVNYFIIKLDENGNLVWKKNINMIYTADYYLGTVRVRGNYLYAGFSTFSISYIKKYDLNFNELINITQTTRSVTSIDVDPQGNIFAAGATGSGTVTFGNLVTSTSFVYNIYFVKYSSSGNCKWAKFVQDVTFQKVNIACDNSGNLFAAGDLSGSFMFGNIQSQGPQWVYDFFLTKLDSSGNFLWLKEVPHTPTIAGDAKKAKINCIAADMQNNVYFCGFLRGSINWGNNVITTCTGVSDIIILKFDPNGIIQKGKRAGGTGGNRADNISLDISGNVFVSGNFSSTAVFDSISVHGTGNINSFLTKMLSSTIGTINLSVIMEGFYDATADNMRMKDTIRIILRNSLSPYSIVDSAKAMIDSNSFTGSFQIMNATTGNYYLQSKHRNALETWSSVAVNYIQGSKLNYDFTSSASQAFGNNMIRVNNTPLRFAIYSGDVNGDGVIDLADMGNIDNDVFNFASGYLNTEINGDGTVDITDAAIADNNAFNFVTKITP